MRIGRMRIWGDVKGKMVGRGCACLGVMEKGRRGVWMCNDGRGGLRIGVGDFGDGKEINVEATGNQS